MALSTLTRPGTSDTIVFLHGLGCVKENFTALWEAPELAGYDLLAVDLPGHGRSRGLPPETWTMQGMAAEVAAHLRAHGPAEAGVHMVAHSMGGAVGLLLAADHDIRLRSFANLEANLVAADCGLLSRRVADADLQAFRDEAFDKLKARARASDDPIVRDWAEWMETCDPEALHASARSLVDWSDGGRLLEIFLGLEVPTVYVYGDRSANPDVIRHLDTVPKHEIAECGHFIMNEKPAELAAVLAELLAREG